jgi:triphosphoribosyl-dephospho-CoA synthetase
MVPSTSKAMTQTKGEILKEFKDQVAREKNFADWVDMLANDHYTNIELRHDKAALKAMDLYAEQLTRQKDERIEELEKGLKEIMRMSRYNKNHDEMLYAVQDVNQFAKKLLNKQ